MKFQTILADPPWWYADQRKVRKDGKTPTRGIGACHHYGQLATTELAALNVQSVTAERCHLYLWATMPLLPDALRVMDAWGFRWATVAFCWIKINPLQYANAVERDLQIPMFDIEPGTFLDHLAFFGPGFYTGSNIELVLLGTKGRPFHHAKGCKASQIVFAPRGQHSAKPEQVQARIEWMYPNVLPRLEMFARRAHPGWMCIGNEAPGYEGQDIRDSLARLAAM